jgi:hypothetical protein
MLKGNSNFLYKLFYLPLDFFMSGCGQKNRGHILFPVTEMKLLLDNESIAGRVRIKM